MPSFPCSPLALDPASALPFTLPLAHSSGWALVVAQRIMGFVCLSLGAAFCFFLAWFMLFGLKLRKFVSLFTLGSVMAMSR